MIFFQKEKIHTHTHTHTHILSDRSDFHMIDSLSIAVHVFVSNVSMSFLVDQTPVSCTIPNEFPFTPSHT